MTGLTAFVDAELAYLAAHWPRDLPTGIIHADLFPDNVLFLGERAGLIDFYFACTDAYAYDLAICLNAWCFEADGSYNITKGSSMIARLPGAPRAGAGRDRGAADPGARRGVALRADAAGRLAQRAGGRAWCRPKDPAEYIARLRFHQRVAGASELGVAS